MELEVLDALLLPDGRELVARLTPFEEADALTTLAAVRRDPRWADRPELVAAAATQARLRTRATSRFPGPPRWWTPDGLEQATRPEVAARHAQRFRAAGIDHVTDLGCGVGSDALALASARITVAAIDRDPAAVWALRATAADLSLPITALLGDVREWQERHEAAAATFGCFVDPARRRAGARQHHPEAWSPPWSWVCALAERMPATGAKVAPGIDHTAIPGGAQSEWTSVDGDLVEAGIWWGPLRAGPARRIATTLRTRPPQRGLSGDPVVVSLDDSAGVPDAVAGDVGDWLVEPDPAVIRAGLVTVLADRVGGWLLDPRIAYVTADTQPPDSQLGTAYRLLDELPFARKRLRAALVARGYGDVVIKKRGVAVQPEQLRRDLRLAGAGPTATVVLTRTDAGPRAFLVSRVDRPSRTDP